MHDTGGRTKYVMYTPRFVCAGVATTATVTGAAAATGAGYGGQAMMRRTREVSPPSPPHLHPPPLSPPAGCDHRKLRSFDHTHFHAPTCAASLRGPPPPPTLPTHTPPPHKLQADSPCVTAALQVKEFAFLLQSDLLQEPGAARRVRLSLQVRLDEVACSSCYDYYHLRLSAPLRPRPICPPSPLSAPPPLPGAACIRTRPLEDCMAAEPLSVSHSALNGRSMSAVDRP